MDYRKQVIDAVYDEDACSYVTNKAGISEVYKQFKPIFFKEKLKTTRIKYVLPEQLEEFYDNLKSGVHNAHELIISSKLPIRFFMDIDYTTDSKKDSGLIKKIIEDVEVFFKVWVLSNKKSIPYPDHLPSKMETDTQFQIPDYVPKVYYGSNCRSIAKGKYKYSIHIHASDAKFPGTCELRNFIDIRLIPFLDRIGRQWHKYIDKDVYRRFGSLRMIHSRKDDNSDNAILRPPVDNFEYFRNTLITYNNDDDSDSDDDNYDEIDRELKSKSKRKIRRHDTLDNGSEFDKMINEILDKEFDDPIGFSIREVNGKMIVFDRCCESLCKICFRVHEHDNSLIAIIGSNFEKIKFMCRRQKSDSPFNTWRPRVVELTDEQSEIIRKEFGETIEQKKPKKSNVESNDMNKSYYRDINDNTERNFKKYIQQELINRY